MTKKTFFIAASIAALLPLTALALEGIGPRITVSGTVVDIKLSTAELNQEFGGQAVLRSTNGQLVNVLLTKDTEIISEGRSSRRQLLPVNIAKGMEMRIRGWRTGTDSLTASLAIILNIQLNPTLSLNGTLIGVEGGTISVLTSDGRTKKYTITHETEVNMNYTVWGPDGFSLIGKQILLTLNPLDPTKVRVVRITGKTGIR